MDKREKELADYIESGEYFSDSKNWYMHKYNYFFIERSFMIIFLALMVGLFYLVNKYHNEISPIVKGVPIRVEISDASEEYSRIKYLGNDKKDFDVNEVLIKYFTKKFITAIESYDYSNNFKQLTVNSKIIEQLASEPIFLYYKDKTSIRSENSIVLKYRRNVRRLIYMDEKSIEVSELNKADTTSYKKEYQILAQYAVREVLKSGRARDELWQSKITLDFEKIHYDFEKKGFNDFNFTVRSYNTEKIKDIKSK